jgi:type I restriction enzyme M protein
MFEQTFKNIDNVLRTEAGCQNELDYIEQPSWIIFLKYLDDLEADREAAVRKMRRSKARTEPFV